MIYTEATIKAMRICYEAHKGQVDKGGMPYVFHPYHLAEQMTDEDTVVTALLHDVIEDSAYTADALRREGFGEHIIHALELLTHRDGEPYESYIERIKTDRTARTVKLADLRHNSDTTRLSPDNISESRIRKYRRAIEVLTDDLPQEE